jgi:D-arabinose 1-dehydrogenase-like Zn-dependent alcohol dehydrogenase
VSGPNDIADVAIELEAIQVGRAAGVGRMLAGGEPTGPRVLVGPIDPCGECDVCRRGGAAVCPLARRRDSLGATVTAARRWLVELGDGLELPSPAAAAVAGDVALAYTLYARAGVAPREPVVVVGGSPIGRFLIEVLLAKGISPAALTGPGPWADWLREKSVAVAVDRAQLTEVFAAHGVAGRPWRLFCVDPAAIPLCVELAGPRATLTLLADDATRPIDGAALAREVAIIGVAGAHPDLVVEAAAMCAKREIDLTSGTTTVADPLRTHVHTLPARR